MIRVTLWGFESKSTRSGMATGCLTFFGLTSISRVITFLTRVKQPCLVGRSDTFLSLAEQLLDLFLLDRPQILAVADEAVGVVAAARVDML